ncbi:MAG TPA: S41 family peptidase, partial [Myxococcaceae bacterium]|nr:S41 family peptidase [Myxococcaceae bacterium]
RVAITVERKVWEKAQAMVLTRALINIESVQSKLLAQNVGYVRLKNFQGNTTRHLQASLESLAKEAGAGGLKGLVLDLRGNPGGLLEQAIQVSDLFLSKGSIVTTVGLSDKLREEKRAHADDGDKNYPIAVLVNAGSASASEIVAGALKNLNRAVVIGRQTFGKGSVQVLYDFQDESALKLTIAKYLTPGDISIQEVGIVPDIALVPTRVTRERLDVFAPRKSSGEADLEQHFGNPGSQAVAKKREEVLGRGGKSPEELKYLKEDGKQKDAAARAQLTEEGKAPKLSKNDKGGVKKPGEKDKALEVDMSGADEDLDDQLDAESQDEIKEDFEVQFARDFVLKAPSSDREKMLQTGKSFLQERRRAEEERINGAIEALGVDWKPGPTPKNVQLTATLKPGSEKRIMAGDVLELEVTVENRGTDVVRRLRAWTDSENPFLDKREFVFGAVKPGERRSWKVPVKLPKELTARRDEVSVKFYDDRGLLPEAVSSEMSFGELPRPAFAFNWQVNDACPGCNGDGLIQRGEQVELLLDVTNSG